MTKEERILVYGINHPSILFYSERRIIGISDKDSLQNALKYDSPRFAIAKSKEIDDLKKIGFTVILDDGKYALLERQ
jgi:hypothetical protein